MSEEKNADIIRRAWSRYTKRPISIDDVRGGWLEDILPVFDPAVEYDISALRWPGATMFHGHEGIRQFHELWFSSFGRIRFELERNEAVGDQVVSIVHQEAQGATSGAPVELRFGMVLTMDAGKIVYARFYLDPEDALEAAGLRG